MLIAVFTMAERQVDRRLDDVVRDFADAPLIAARSLPAAARRLATALRRRDAALGDALCLVLALAVSLSALPALPMHSQASWIVAPAAEGEGMRVTLAGLCAATVSNTLHWFLALQWLESLAIWRLLLRGVAQLDLRLSATHPDGYGGLAFVGLYPNVFAAHVFALRCVLGAAVWRMLSTGDLDPVTYGTVMAGWLAIVLALFLVPLAAFSAPLARFKRRELEAAASQATDHGHAAERAVLGENLAAPADPAEPEDTVDSGKLYAAARKLATLPFAREALLPLCAGALVPLAISGASQWPVK